MSGEPWRRSRRTSKPASGSPSLPNLFSCNEQAGGQAGGQGIGHAFLALGIEQFELLLAMLDDPGLEQQRRQRGPVKNDEIVVIPDAVFGIGRLMLAAMPVRRDEAGPAQHGADARGTAQAGSQIGVAGRNENSETTLDVGIARFAAIPVPELEIGQADRVVMDGNEKVAARRLLRAFGETRNVAGEIHGAHAQAMPLQGPGQTN